MGGVRLSSHSPIKVLAVRFRLAGDNFVSAGHGISLRSPNADAILAGRGVASAELVRISMNYGAWADLMKSPRTGPWCAAIGGR